MSEHSQRELISSVKNLKLTLPRMSNLGIPTTPENFAVWYEYSTGSRLDLNKAIDDLLNNGTYFTEEVNRELYLTYIATDSQKQIKEIQKEVKNIVNNMTHHLQGLKKEIKNFDGLLNNCSGELTAKPEVEDFRRLMNHLMDETHEIQKSSQQLEKGVDKLNLEVDSLQLDIEKLTKEASVDELTGIENRRAFDRNLEQAIEFANGSDHRFCLIMADIDNFKMFNDRYGHPVGDKVIQFIANSFKNSVKGKDKICRYGGDELAVILPDTDLEQAISVADYICATVAQHKLCYGKIKKSIGSISVTLGVAEYRFGEDADDLITRADNALYHAKEAGKSCVCSEKDIRPQS